MCNVRYLPIEEASNVSVVQIAVLCYLVPRAATCPGFYYTWSCAGLHKHIVLTSTIKPADTLASKIAELQLTHTNLQGSLWLEFRGWSNLVVPALAGPWRCDEGNEVEKLTGQAQVHVEGLEDLGLQLQVVQAPPVLLQGLDGVADRLRGLIRCRDGRPRRALRSYERAGDPCQL